MPDMTPVANQIQPPDPTKGINTFAGILGLKQRQLAIQTAQAALPGVQAESQQQVQTAGQRSALAQYMQNTDLEQHVGKDGTIDLNILSDPELRRAAGDSFPQVAQSLLTVKNSQLEAKSRLAGLNDTLRTQFNRTVGSLREDDDVKADNNVGRAKVRDAMEQFSASGGPDAQRITDIYRPMLEHVPHGRLASSLGHLQMQAQSATEQQGQQNPVMGSFDTGQQILPFVASRSTGIPQPTGQTVPKQLTPAQQPAYLAKAAEAGAAGTGVTGIDLDRAREVGNLQQSSSANIELTKQIDRLADDINSGKVSKMISETGNYLGMSSINQARSQLNKDLGQVRGAVAGRAGSDAKAAEILEGYPTDTTPTQTTHAAMDYIRGTLRQNLARGQLLQQYQKEDPQAVRGFASADNILTRNTDPLMHEYMALKPEERGAFYRRNFGTAQEAQAFKDQVSATRKHTILAQ